MKILKHVFRLIILCFVLIQYTETVSGRYLGQTGTAWILNIFRKKVLKHFKIY